MIFRFLSGALLFAALLPAQAEPALVKTAVLSDVAIHPLRTAPATVVSLNATAISAQIPARVEQITVRVGDIVERGQLLAQLDCTDYALARREAEARVESLEARIVLAERRLQRTEKLTVSQTVSAELLDERESELTTLRGDRRAAAAQLEMARINQGRCEIRSPFYAVVNERAASVGQFAEMGTALVRIIDLDETEISAQVFNADVDQLAGIGELHFEHGGQRYPVKLRASVPAINTETRNREVRLLFVDGPALPGAAGKLVWRDPRPHVPAELIVRREGRLGVFTAVDGAARFIEMPEALAGQASPTSLPGSTALIIEGHYALKEAEPVSVAP